MKHFLPLFLMISAVQMRAEHVENLDALLPSPILSVCTEVSIGEFIDKITILQIKKERIKDEKKIRNIIKELESLLTTHASHLPQSTELEALTHELLEVNKKLWDIEDAIRDKELLQEFDGDFIALARSVYNVNDERFRIKREINALLGSRLVEEKSYKKYK